MPLGFSFQEVYALFFRAYLSYPLAFFFSLFRHRRLPNLLLLFLTVSSAHLLHHHHLWDERAEMLSILPLAPPPPLPTLPPYPPTEMVITRKRRQTSLEPPSFLHPPLVGARSIHKPPIYYFVSDRLRPLRTKSSYLSLLTFSGRDRQFPAPLDALESRRSCKQHQQLTRSRAKPPLLVCIRFVSSPLVSTSFFVCYRLWCEQRDLSA